MMTRRTPFVAALALTALAVAACDSAALPETVPPVEVHTWTSGGEGFDTHSHWIDTGAEVVVFDAQFTPALAEAVLADIQATTDSPVRYVVVTHPNPDKFNGAPVFQAAGAVLVASEATAAAMPGVHAYKEAYFVGAGMFEAGSYPALPQVDLTFSGSLTLDTAVPVTLTELSSPGVTSTQTVAVAGNAVFAGDLTAGQAHAWLEGAILDGVATPYIDGWLAALDELAALAPAGAVLYPGRGAILPVQKAAPAQQDYLRTADRIVADYVAGLDEPLAALTGPDAGSHYAALTAELEAAFPAYDLGYLVTYGVYGLALQHAAQ